MNRKDAQALSMLLYGEIRKISLRSAEPGQQCHALGQLLDYLLAEMSAQEAFHFTTTFARLVYVAQRYRLKAPLPFYLHWFRRSLQGHHQQVDPDTATRLGQKALLTLVQVVSQEPVPEDLRALSEAPWPDALQPVAVKAFIPNLRVVAVALRKAQKQLVVQLEDGENRIVLYDLPERNITFHDSIIALEEVFGFPTTLQLLEVQVDAGGLMRPAGIVIEPDYLIDVTAVAECFKGRHVLPESYLLHKFKPVLPNRYLLLGHVANFFLDELISDPDADYRETLPKVFRLQPLGMSLLSDRELKEMLGKAQLHWIHLKKVIAEEFPKLGIDREACYLEPTFLSNVYGLQGRLDLFYRHDPKSAIVELKSGTPFMANSYGIGANHFTQTLLYYLLIHSAFGSTFDPQCYILYSSQGDHLLRYAPLVRAQQMEALRLRNDLLRMEWQLMRLDEGDLLGRSNAFFQRLSTAALPQARGFTQRDLDAFSEAWDGLDDLERKYMGLFSAFVAREHLLAKMGNPDHSGAGGQAGLWLNGVAEKEEQYEIMRGLRFESSSRGGRFPRLRFTRGKHTNELANFRLGDLIVLYPQADEGGRVLQNQIFKGHISKLDETGLEVSLRSQQFPETYLTQYDGWNLEHDHYDGSFNAMFRALYTFMGFSPATRKLLMGRRPPARPLEEPATIPAEGMTSEQHRLLKAMISSPEYYLLWGPPGTGKTSIMLRSFVRYLLAQTEERLLLLAYTNRAVDEMCRAVSSLGDPWDSSFLRIGSATGADPAFREQLLDTQLQKIHNRLDLLTTLKDNRIILSTVASVSNKPELFALLSFDRIVIDEASQVLEPALAGLLGRARQFVLIGDHQQLPAVVAQPASRSAISDPDLNELGMHNARNSLFERLYLRCRDQGWTWAYGQLSHQGRMHRDIMDFPSDRFYSGSLRILPEGLLGRERQMQKLDPETMQGVLGQRISFMDTPIDPDTNYKTNRYEAVAIATLLARFRQRYGENKSIGVITPYRAQIAQIRASIVSSGGSLTGITVDTVERYQGGARDVILLSLCTNSPVQLRSLISLSDEGVDRKLNVAMTRAREHLVILGNEALLGQVETYRQLIERYKVAEQN